MLIKEEVNMSIRQKYSVLWCILVFVILGITGKSGADIWQDQRPLRIEENLLDIQFVGQNGWIAGGDVGSSVVYHSYDGGLTWQKEVPLPYGYNLNALYFIDSQNGWAVGRYGEIIYTSDGTNWMSQTSGTTSDLGGVHFIDSLRGFAAGDQVILETYDAGTTWQLNAVDAHLDDIYFIDALHGWTCGWLAKMFYTSDGGVSWDSIGDITGYDLSSIYFSDSLHGWTIGSKGFTDGCIFVTQDGGNSWSSQETTNFHLSSIFGLDSLRLWV
ncbi:hypothetical protein KAU34_09745, partial [candidate division WOR-3 bacterium]|nr:hypothetical protein [candidate division WOR-3 bacterium]